MENKIICEVEIVFGNFGAYGIINRKKIYTYNVDIEEMAIPIANCEFGVKFENQSGLVPNVYIAKIGKNSSLILRVKK